MVLTVRNQLMDLLDEPLDAIFESPLSFNGLAGLVRKKRTLAIVDTNIGWLRCMRRAHVRISSLG
jgi:hypothetical protein